MRKELEDILFHRYPKLFVKRELAPGQFAISRGIECGDGWFDLIDTLCSQLQYSTDHAGELQVRVTQIKSKLGTLRFNFLGSGGDYARGMQHMALACSALICEECGATHCEVHRGPSAREIYG